MFRRRNSTDQTPTDAVVAGEKTALSAGQNLPPVAPAVNRWQLANRKLTLLNREAMASFHQALLKALIAAEDPPGEYAVTVFGKSFPSRPLLTRMWASTTGAEYTLTHSSVGQHTLSWAQPITSPEGGVLEPGMLNLY
eukprot:575252-Prymnesium_polylepis.1